VDHQTQLLVALTGLGLERHYANLSAFGLDILSIAQADENDWDDFGITLDDGVVLQRAMAQHLGQSSEPEPEPELEPEPEPEPLVLPAAICGSQVASCVRFPGDECPVCFDSWAGPELRDEKVVAFACGHALCQVDLVTFWKECKKPFRQETAYGRLRTEYVCPSCREPLGDDDPREY
jgi:hypothetical protein